MPRPRTRRAAALTALALVLTGCPDDDSSGDVAAFCERYAALGEFVQAAVAGPEELEDIPAARALADDIGSAARSVAEIAPEEIEEEARRLASVTGELAGELSAFYEQIEDDPARANDPAFLSEFQPLTEERREELVAAGDDVRPFVERHCAQDTEPTMPPRGER